MKRISLIVFMFALINGQTMAQVGFALWSEQLEEFKVGDGTEENPFIISTPKQLAYLAKMVNENKNYSLYQFFKLDNDIDLIGQSLLGEGGQGVNSFWDAPIGTKTSPFQGTFDGDNFCISNMLIADYSSNSCLGLFGCTEGAVIKNLRLEEISSSGYTLIVGSLAGHAFDTLIENCSAKRFELTTVQEKAGGLVGEALENTVIKNSSASGKIIDVGNSCVIGGFAAYVADVDFTDCFSEGELSGASEVGGFIGNIGVGSGASVIRNCFSTCKTFGTDNVGGFIGVIENVNVNISGCRASGLALGVSVIVGGFVGSCKGSKGEIRDCLSEGMVTGASNVGGFGGGITGENLKITDCRSTGVSEGIKGNVGGFVGYSNEVHFSGCYATGAVKGETDIGGFGGRLNALLEDCFATGTVEGYENVGGFAGNIYGVLTNCYAVGTVKGYENVGGFVGRIGGSTDNPENCFSAGTVFGTHQSGAFVGNRVDPNNLGGAIEGPPIVGWEKFVNCYYDLQTSGIQTACGTLSDEATDIEALTTARLTDGVILSGFRESKWKYTADYYPQLRVFDESDNADTRLQSALSIVPLKLANDNERNDNVRKIIQLAKTTLYDDAIVWTANPAEDANVVNHALYAFASGEWRTLTLSAGNAERKVIFRSTTNLITADIQSVKINNLPVVLDEHIVGNNFIYNIPCGSNDESVFAEIILGGYANASPVTAMTLFANQTQTVTVTTDDDQKKTYTLTATKSLPSDIFVQRWEDVLAINNDPATNGGYEFTDYKWFKDGVEQPETKGYIRLSGGAAEYTATLSGRSIATQQNVTRTTCPAIVTSPTAKAMIYPNPVERGQSVQICRGVMPYAPYAHTNPTDAVIQLFSPTGNLVIKKTVHASVAEIIMPDAAGAYILQVTVDGVGETYKVVVE